MGTLRRTCATAPRRGPLSKLLWADLLTKTFANLLRADNRHEATKQHHVSVERGWGVIAIMPARFPALIRSAPVLLGGRVLCWQLIQSRSWLPGYRVFANGLRQCVRITTWLLACDIIDSQRGPALNGENDTSLAYNFWTCIQVHAVVTVVNRPYVR